MINRLPTWQKFFYQELLRVSDTEFEFGNHDCCLSVCNCVEAITGVDPAQGIRDTYYDEQSANEIIRKRGGLRLIASTQLKRFNLGYKQRNRKRIRRFS